MQAERSTAGVGPKDVVAQNASYSSAVVQSAIQDSGDSWDSGAWRGSNVVRLNWSNIDTLGPGAVKVQIDYVSMNNGVVETSNEQLLVGDTSGGATLSWEGVGIDSVAAVRVWKQDVNGAWQLVISGGSSGSGQRIVIPRPTDAAGRVKVQVRPAGQGAFVDAQAIDFGDALWLDPSAVGIGDYEYQLSYTGSADNALASSGQIKTVATVLAGINNNLGFASSTNSLLSWSDPGGGVVQTFRYRVLGIANWTSVEVASVGNGLCGVNLDGLSAGNYQYELLYTHAGQDYPYAHSTGSFAVNAAMPTHTVPAVGAPHLDTTMSSGAAYVSASGGAPIATNVVQWSAAFSGAGYEFRIRSSGSQVWTVLPIGDVTSSAGVVTGAGIDVGRLNLVAGSYEIELRDIASGSGAHLTAAMTVGPAVAGHYDNVTVAVQVLHQVVPEDPSHFITGRLNGGPTYGRPVVLGYDVKNQPVFGYGYGLVNGVVSAIPHTEYSTEYQDQQVPVQVVVGQEPEVILDE